MIHRLLCVSVVVISNHFHVVPNWHERCIYIWGKGIIIAHQKAPDTFMHKINFTKLVYISAKIKDRLWMCVCVILSLLLLVSVYVWHFRIFNTKITKRTSNYVCVCMWIEIYGHRYFYFITLTFLFLSFCFHLFITPSLYYYLNFFEPTIDSFTHE